MWLRESLMWAKWALGWRADEEANEEGGSEVGEEGERGRGSRPLACFPVIDQSIKRASSAEMR